MELTVVCTLSGISCLYTSVVVAVPGVPNQALYVPDRALFLRQRKR